MLKKLQALKAKKGFTLVELIVVIAIIAVLAAILVPTLMGQVTKSRITSADSGASSLKETINTWIMNRDVAGNALLKEGSITIAADNTGITTVGGTSAPAAGDKYNPTLTDFLKESIDMKNAYAEAFVKSGKVIAVAYIMGQSSAPSEWPKKTDFDNGTFKWKSNKDGEVGVTAKDGYIIGTSPKLAYTA